VSTNSRSKGEERGFADVERLLCCGAGGDLCQAMRGITVCMQTVLCSLTGRY
jgi:hypothetical protein